MLVALKNNAYRMHFALITFIIVVSFFYLYYGVIITVVSRWINYPHFYGQGLIIFGISVFLVISKRKDMKKTPIQPAWLGNLIVFLGAVIFTFGKLSETNTVFEVSFVITLLGVVWLLLGKLFIKILFVPLLYLVFAFPVFDVVPGIHITFLQNISANIAANILSYAGMPALLNGHLIQLPHISLDVVKTCAGINHIMSLVAIAVPFAYVTNKSRVGKFLLISSAFLIGVVANGSRIALIGLWTFYVDGAEVHGPSDFLLVSFNFLFGFILLIVVSFTLDKLNFKNSIDAKFTNKYDVIAKMPIVKNNTFKLYGIGMVCLFLLNFTSFAVDYYSKIVPVSLNKPLSMIPYNLGEWNGKDQANLSDKFSLIQASSKVNRRYSDGYGNTVDLFIAYFELQKGEREIFNSKFNDVVSLSSHTRIFNLKFYDDYSLKTNEFIYENLNNSRIGWNWYYLDDQLISSPYLAKFLTFQKILLNRTNNAAIIFIITDNRLSNNTDHPKDILQSFSSSLIPTFLKLFSNHYGHSQNNFLTERIESIMK